MDSIIDQEGQQQLPQQSSPNNASSGPDATNAQIDQSMANPDNNHDKVMQNLSKIIDNYGDIDQANHKTVECLIYYLDLPADRNGLNKKFNQAKERKQMPRRMLKNML